MKNNLQNKLVFTAVRKRKWSKKYIKQKQKMEILKCVQLPQNCSSVYLSKWHSCCTFQQRTYTITSQSAIPSMQYAKQRGFITCPWIRPLSILLHGTYIAILAARWGRGSIEMEEIQCGRKVCQWAVWPWQSTAVKASAWHCSILDMASRAKYFPIYWSSKQLLLLQYKSGDLFQCSSIRSQNWTYRGKIQ